MIGEKAEQSLFKRDDILEYFKIQDYSTVTDLISKMGRVSKCFGKGGSIDTARARTKILSDWFSGKMNQLLHIWNDTLDLLIILTILIQ